jgi:hypothetical protein
MVHNVGYKLRANASGCVVGTRCKMKICSIVVVVLLLMAGPGLFAVVQSATEANSSQPRTQPPNPPSKDMLNIVAEFTESLNVKKLKTGSRIKAKVTQDVLSHGKIIIPVDSKLLGHVTEVKERGKDNSESRLGIVFDKVFLKHHEEMDFQAVVQALAAPAPRRSMVDEPDQMLYPSAMNASAITQTTSLAASGPGANRGSGSQNRTTDSRSTRGAALTSNLPTTASDTTSQNLGSTGSSLGVGTQGVFRLKGLSLSVGPSNDTPGPVILSKASDVKLEYGTQVLLRVTDTPVPRP